MSVDGVWRVEMLGPNGWERIATAFLRDGRYLAASADHYSIGNYMDDGETLKVESRTTQHGDIHTVFGSKKEHLDLKMEGRIEGVDRIVVTVKPPEGGVPDLQIFLTRLDA